MRSIYSIDGLIIGSPYEIRKKSWVSAAIGAASSLGSTIFGGMQSSKAEKEAERLRAEGHAANRAGYMAMKERGNDTSAGRLGITQAKDYGKTVFKQESGRSAVGGSTAESAALAKERADNTVGNVMAQNAANDTARMDKANIGIGNDMLTEKSEQAADSQMHAQNVANVASAAGNAIASIAGGLEDSNAKARQSRVDRISSMAGDSVRNASSSPIQLKDSEKKMFEPPKTGSVVDTSKNTISQNAKSIIGYDPSSITDMARQYALTGFKKGGK